MNSDAIDLAPFQPGATSSIEKQHMSNGLGHTERHKAKRQMDEGVHRAVC